MSLNFEPMEEPGVSFEAEKAIIEKYFRGFVGPSDNLPLSSADFSKALQICNKLENIWTERESYITENKLNKSIFVSSNLWGQYFCEKNFRKLLERSCNVLNNLRLFSSNFSGYSPFDMTFAEGKPLVEELPDNLDQCFRDKTTQINKFVIYYFYDRKYAPKKFVVVPPRMFCEVGWDIGGIVVNYDTWAIQIRVNALYALGVFNFIENKLKQAKVCHVLEIGAGYGALAYSLQNFFPQLCCTIVDLPESLLFSSIYLGITRPEIPQLIFSAETTIAEIQSYLKGQAFIFVANHFFDKFCDYVKSIDVAINTLSLSEMSPLQVEYYGAKTAALLKTTHGIFFEQNYVVKDIHTDINEILAKSFGYRLQAKDTLARHKPRGDVNIWSNSYIPEIFDISDRTAFDDMQKFAAEYKLPETVELQPAEPQPIETQPPLKHNVISSLRQKIRELI